MCDVTRRGFLVGCSAAIAGLAGSRFSSLAFADDSTTNRDILVKVFLRGGMDGLNFVPPIGGVDRGHYEGARPDLRVPATGAGAALPLEGIFGLHPAAAALHGLFQDGKLAFVHAAGLDHSTRSHFDAMEFIERGTPGDKTTGSGWLTRHLASSPSLPPEILVPSLAVGSTQQSSLLGDRTSLNMQDVGDFRLDSGYWRWNDAQRTALRRMYGNGGSLVHLAGVQALDAVDLVELNAGDGYTPANGAVYPGGSFGEHLELVARMIKADVGLRVATVDLGGWDTHEGQGDGSGGYFADLVEELADGLAAFYLDLDSGGSDNPVNRITVVFQGEFGRRLRQNADHGSDHGHGGVMGVLGGRVNGGRVYGQWPGLGADQLFDNADLAVTTDYRRVLSEILIRRLCNPRLGEVFPGYEGYQPLGIVQGADLIPDYGDTIFSDGFETGSPSRWSTHVG